MDAAAATTSDVTPAPALRLDEADEATPPDVREPHE